MLSEVEMVNIVTIVLEPPRRQVRTQVVGFFEVKALGGVAVVVIFEISQPLCRDF